MKLTLLILDLLLFNIEVIADCGPMFELIFPSFSKTGCISETQCGPIVRTSQELHCAISQDHDCNAGDMTSGPH